MTSNLSEVLAHPWPVVIAVVVILVLGVAILAWGVGVKGWK